MPDQRDDLNSLDDIDAFPPDLRDVHRLLLRDGARWRVRLPDPASQTPIEQQDARVSHRVAATPTATPGTRGSHDIQQNVRKEVIMDDTTHIDDTPRPPVAPPVPTAGRFRGIAAVGVALAVVALFAVLLYSFTPGRSTNAALGVPKATHVPATATTQRNDSGWSTVASLQQQPVVPIFAPSQPGTIYEAAPSVLRRSDDGGQIWHNLTLPPGSGTSQADVSILVSPLDAQKVMLEVTAYQAQGVMTCPTAFSPGHNAAVASNGAVPLSSKIPLGGLITCTLQYYSADGGQHWTHLHAPSGAVLGNKSAEARVPGTPSTPIFAQGSRLYTYAGCGPLCMGPGLRIVTSTDGGATWSYADDVLAGQGAHVCSFMPASSGSTIFALASTTSCPADGVTPSLALWRSTNAGATWSQATLPAGGQTPQSLLVVSHSSGQPLLYLNLQAPPQPHTGAGPSAPADLRVSADGGRHWSAAPATGVPTGNTTVFGPVGVLSDGTVVEPFFDPSWGQSHPTFYGWKQGDAAWHAIGKTITIDGASFVSLTVVPADSGKSDQLWVVTAGSSPQGGIIYDVSVATAGK